MKVKISVLKCCRVLPEGMARMFSPGAVRYHSAREREQSNKAFCLDNTRGTTRPNLYERLFHDPIWSMAYALEQWTARSRYCLLRAMQKVVSNICRLRCGGEE